MGEEMICGYAEECPCGCGWVMCAVFGEFMDRYDCDNCNYKEKEENDG